MVYLFVYGTLLKDFKHEVHQQLKSDITYFTRATIRGALYDLGDYAGYTEELTGDIKGEVYSIKDPEKVFKVLDEYEGLLNDEPEYIRKEIEIELPDGERIASWIYIYQRQLSPEHEIIISGDYLAYVRNKG